MNFVASPTQPDDDKKNEKQKRQKVKETEIGKRRNTGLKKIEQNGDEFCGNQSDDDKMIMLALKTDSKWNDRICQFSCSVF